MKILKAASIYFLLVFGTGFALGLVRVPLLVPRLGQRYAELLEMPFMFVAIVLAARFVVRRHSLAGAIRDALITGLIALALLLLAEWAVDAWLQQRSIAEYLATRDPVSGAVYAGMLMIFAAMPVLIVKRAT